MAQAVIVQEHRVFSTIQAPAKLIARFFFKNHKSEPDLSNAIQGFEDLLEKLQIIQNDKLFHRLELQKFFGESEERTEIEIWDLET